MMLVLSPFVRHEIVRGRPCLVCRDPYLGRGQAVVRSPLIDRVVARAADPQEISSIVAQESEADATEVERVVASLVTASILSDPAAHRPPRPTIELELTNRCNADCVMCPRQDLRPLGTMTPEVLEGSLALIEGSGAGVILQGIGEPTLYPELPQTIRHIRALLPAGAPILMVTNGFRASLDHLDAYFDAGLSHVQWSFHSLDDARHGRILGSTQGATRSREHLVAALGRHAERLSVNMVVMDSNRAEVEDLRLWLAEHGLSPGRLRLIPVFSRGESIQSASLSHEGEREVGAHCLYTRKSMFVAWDGRVLPCSNDIQGSQAYGHVLEQPPEALIRMWWDDLVRAQYAFDACARCDHASRRSLSTSWFEHALPHGAGEERAHG